MYNIHVHVCREDVNYWDTSQPKLPLLKLSDLYTSLSSFINLSVAWTEPHTVPWRKRNNIEKIWNKKNCNFQMISSYTVVLQLFWITSNLRFLKCFRTLDFSWMSIKHYHSVQSWLVKYCSNNEQKLQLGYSRKNPHPPDGWGPFLTPPLKFNLFLMENTCKHV